PAPAQAVPVAAGPAATPPPSAVGAEPRDGSATGPADGAVAGGAVAQGMTGEDVAAEDITAQDVVAEIGVLFGELLDLPPVDPGADLWDLGATSFTMVRAGRVLRDRKSTRLNSSHVKISYAVFCLKKKNRIQASIQQYIKLENSIA